MSIHFKSFFFLLLALFCQPIFAQNWCNQYLYDHPGFDSRRDGSRILSQLRTIETLQSGIPVRLQWNINRPVRIPRGESEAKPFKRQLSYVFTPQGDPEFLMISRFSPGSSFFMERILEGYSNTFNKDVVQLVKDLNDLLDPLRSDKADLVSDPSGNNRKIIGTVQVYDASEQRDYVYQSGQLPVEISLEFRGLNKGNLSKKITDLKIKHPGLRLFEIGRLTASGNSVQSNAILRAFELFIENYYLRHFPNSYFVAHVATPIHLRLFKSRYGMTLIDTIELPNGNKEYVLGILGRDFRKILQSRKQK